MLCPACDASETYMRHGSPVIAENGAIMRRHKCLNCRRLFLSAQQVVKGADVEAWLDLVEPLPAPEISSSSVMPVPVAIYATEALDYLATTGITA